MYVKSGMFVEYKYLILLSAFTVQKDPYRLLKIRLSKFED